MKDRTDWERVRNMTDEEIDAGILADPDAPPELDDAWLDEAEIVSPEKKTAVHIRLDSDVVHYFKQSGRGYQSRINAVLRSYMQAKRRPPQRRTARKTRTRQ